MVHGAMAEAEAEELPLSQQSLDSLHEEVQDLEEGNGKVWWAKLLFRAAMQKGYNYVELRKCIQLVSACTGSFAEAAVLQDRFDIQTDR